MAQERTQRRLAAILVADVVGYSRLMEADEIGTLAALKSRRKEVLKPLVAKHQGRVFKPTVEDGLDNGSAFVERALALNSNLAAAWGFSGWMKVCFGEPDTAIKRAAFAMRLSPVDPRIFAWQYYTALAHLSAGGYDEAVSWAERALRENPNMSSPIRVAAVSHALAGRVAEARQIMERIRQLDPELRLSNLGNVLPPFRRAEDRARFVDGLWRAGLPE